MSRLAIAVDNQISLRVVEKLKQHFDVVRWAGQDPDEVWVEDALCKGATIFISPDLDVPLLLDRWDITDVKWIDVPQGLATEKQYDFLMKKLEKVA